MANAHEVDEGFYDRADAVIKLANTQCGAVGRGKVSASTLFGAARFNAWITASSYASAAAMQDDRADAVDYFVQEYRAMFEQHFDDYVANFARYMTPPAK
jgi:hypothetical protein